MDGDCVTVMKSVHTEDGTRSRIIIGMHVDDDIVATDDENIYEQLITELQEDFKLRSYGKLGWYLGYKIEQVRRQGYGSNDSGQVCARCSRTLQHGGGQTREHAK